MATPAEETYHEFRARFDGAMITTYSVAMLVVPLKIWCRHRTGGWRNMGLDEAFTGIATLSVSATFWVIMTAVRPLLGKRFAIVMQSPEDFAKVPMFSLCLWIANVLYVVAVFSMKLSMVALYWKLFGVDRKSRLPLIVMAFVIIGWSTGVFISVIFACKPIAGSWDIALALTAKCIDKKQFYQGASIPNVITDVILVLMPIPYVLKLHAPMAQRIVLAGIFALGTFVGVVSVIRLSILVGTTNGVPDLTYTFKDVYLWSLIELQVGLICICLPSLRPLVRVLGLNDLFSFSRSRPSHTPDPYRGLSKGKTDQSASRKTNNSLFGTHDGTRIGEEDEFEMIGKPERMEGKNSTWTGQTSRVSCDTDSASHDSAASRLPPQPHAGIGRGITVQREWDVSHSTQR